MLLVWTRLKAAYSRPQLLGARLTVDSMKLTLAVAYDVATDLKRQRAGFPHAAVSHQSIFPPQFCLDVWCDIGRVARANCDCALWVKCF